MTKNEAALETVNAMISELKAFDIVSDLGIGHGIKGQYCAMALNGLNKMADEIAREIKLGKEW